jgi:predicted ATPase with chaperone activity
MGAAPTNGDDVAAALLGAGEVALPGRRPAAREAGPARTVSSIPRPAPPEPATLADTGVSRAELESLTLKVLLQRGNSTGSAVADLVCLPRGLAIEMLDRLRDELLVAIKTSAGVHDYLYQLTDAGFERAQRQASRCGYVGPAPVPFDQYLASVTRQSLQNTRLTLDQLRRALSNLVIHPCMISQLGQALNDGQGLFLYGNPGNGKTSIAERLCDAYGQVIWIPQTISVHGELLRLYDASCHKAVDITGPDAGSYDRRWIAIRRPTIVVGGELTLEYLETRLNASAGIIEAPVQLKSNCGTLVIDDFGRQRASSTDILNRLIVPLEKHCDYLYLASGRQIQVPFDQLLVLSTNLEPRDLLDEAFLRRIPYKIEVSDPSEADFRMLLEHQARSLGFEFDGAAVDYLIEQHYRQAQRPLRFCHPRDLLRQIKNCCEVHDRPKRLTPEAFDTAVRNYFASL